MKKTILLILFQMLWVAGFSQSLPPEMNRGIFFHPTNLVVHWKAAKHPWPERLWVLQMVPAQFSPTTISNLMALGPFTDKDKTDHGTNDTVFSNSSGTLIITHTMGVIEFHASDTYDLKRLRKNVPETNQLFRLATNFLPKLGISLSEVATDGTGKPEFTHINDMGSIFYNPMFTNITARDVFFHRASDGVKFLPGGAGGEIYFGENGKIVQMRLMWPTYKPDKLYFTATPKKIIQWVREGRAMQRRASDNSNVFDWTKAKSLTINKAAAYYYGQLISEEPVFPCWVRPLAELWGTVDIGKTNIPVDIICPLIVETKP